jgi:hypothetical protein
MHVHDRNPTIAESFYCATPDDCREVDVLIVGAGIGLASVEYLMRRMKAQLGKPLRVAVVDAGPFDLPTHLGNTRLDRHPFLRAPELGRVGGRLALWGLSTPRPPEATLRRWAYPYDDLTRRFHELEHEMGIDDPIPCSAGLLEAELTGRLKNRFDQSRIGPAPLAMDRYTHRWSPLDQVPRLVAEGLTLLAQFHCERIEMADARRVAGVRGIWRGKADCHIAAKVVVLGLGFDATPRFLARLVRDLGQAAPPSEPSDHIRIDLHGRLSAEHLGAAAGPDAGVAVLLMECTGERRGVPYHLEIKAAAPPLWAAGFMPSGDNLRGAEGGVWLQVQAIAAMHDRFPMRDLLNVGSGIRPVMSLRDMELHAEIARAMTSVAAVLGLHEPTFATRPLLENHHAYGLLRVGKGVDEHFRLAGFDNLYVLPPTAYVDEDDDANPVLKSRVLAQYAIDDVVRRLDRERAEKPHAAAA